MSTTAITLNGTSFAKCKGVQENDAKIGVAITAANGSRRFAQRAQKSTFVLSFEGMTISETNTLRGIAALTTTFAYVDGHGTSTTVVCLDDPLSIDTPTIDNNTDIWYDAQLTVYEA